MKRTLVDHLKPGEVLGHTLYNERGDVLLQKGMVITERYLQFLSERGFRVVWIQDEDTADISNR